MVRSIPPRTTLDIHRAKPKPAPDPSGGKGFFKKHRDWRFQTKPFFKKINGPLVDVFHEAEEVLIVIDLGGFRRGDVTLKMTSEKYSIFAKRGDQEFREEIALPTEVDIEQCSECFRNGVLEIVLPLKNETGKQ